MAIDTEQPYSPGWWFKRLACMLQDRRCGRLNGRSYTRRTLLPQRVRPGLDLIDDYYRGDPPLVGCPAGWESYFYEVVRMGRLNVAELIVSAKAERMRLTGARTAAAGDEVGDDMARQIMRHNRFQLLTRDVHDTFLGFGDGYTLITPATSPDVIPTITAEDPREVITADDPLTGKPMAALKLYRDDWDSTDFAYVFVKDQGSGKVRLYVASKDGATVVGSTSPFRMSRGWDWIDDKEQAIPGTRVPIVRFRNKHGVGEFERHLDTLDRINDQILNKLVIAKVQAFRQRGVEGLEDYDDDGNLIDYTNAFEAAPGAMWKLPPGTKMWESTPTDLGPLRLAIKDDLENLCAVTATPLPTVTPDAAQSSAEGATLQREENTFAVEDRLDRGSVGWAETLSIAFDFMGDAERADVSEIEPMWAPIERFSLLETAGAAAQLKGLLPAEAIFVDVLQYDPADLPNLRAMRAADLLFEPPPTPASGGGSQPPVPSLEHLVPGPNPNATV